MNAKLPLVISTLRATTQTDLIIAHVNLDIAEMDLPAQVRQERN